MHHRRSLRLAAAGLAGAVIGVTGFGGVAAADPVEELPTVIENVPGAVEVLVAGLQGVADTALGTQSAVATAAVVGDTLVATGTALVAGTEQLGALSLGFLLINGGTQQALAPFLEAIDDPATATDVLTPEDVSTILGNLPVAVDALLHGDAAITPADPNGATCAVAEALRGNLIFGPGFGAIGTPATVGCGATGVIGFLVTLTQGTNHESLPTPILATALVGAIAGADYVQQLEDALAPVFEAIGDLTEPVAAIVEGV